MAFKGSAYAVYARVFNLISSAGRVVGSLLTDRFLRNGGFFMWPTAFPGIKMFHNNANTLDSILTWSNDTTDTGTETLYIVGPSILDGVSGASGERSYTAYSAAATATDGSMIANTVQGTTSGYLNVSQMTAASTVHTSGLAYQVQVTNPATPTQFAYLSMQYGGANRQIDLINGTATVYTNFQSSPAVASLQAVNGGTVQVNVDSSTGKINLNPTNNVALNGRNAYLPVGFWYIASNANIAGNAGLNSIPGLNQAVTMKAGDYLTIDVSLDIECTAAGSQTNFFVFASGGWINGTIGLIVNQTAGVRMTVCKQVLFVAPTTGIYTIDVLEQGPGYSYLTPFSNMRIVQYGIN